MDSIDIARMMGTISERLKNENAPSESADEKTIEEEQDLERQKAELELARERTHNASLENDLSQRKTYADRIFFLIVGWLICLVLIVLLQGFGSIIGYKFHLDNTVLVTFIGGTTVNVIGLFGIVVTYLFKK